MIEAQDRLSDKALLNILILSKDATAVYTGANLHIQLANDAMLKLWGKDRSILGLTFEAALPELADQPFANILMGVWRTGKDYIAKDNPADLVVDGRLQTFYFDFIFKAITDEQGVTCAILHTANEVSDRMQAWHMVEEKSRRETNLREELAAANKELAALNEEHLLAHEELSSLNEEYLSTNDELNTLNEELKSLNEEYLSINDELNTLNEEYLSTSEELGSLNEEYLSANEELAAMNEEIKSAYNQLGIVHEALLITEQKAKVLLEGAPIAVGVIDGYTYQIDTANDILLSLWNTDKQAIGQPVTAILPMVKADILTALIKQIKQEGKTLYGDDELVVLNRDARPTDTYFNFIYQPVFNAAGKVVCVMIVASEVTEQRNSRAALQQANEEINKANASLNISNEQLTTSYRQLANAQLEMNKLYRQLSESEVKFRQAIDSGKLGTWNIDPASRRLTLSVRAREIFGFETDTAVSIEQMLTPAASEYQPLLQDALNRAMVSYEECDVTYPIIAGDTQIQKWVRATGKAYTSSEGRIISYSGMVMEVTEQKEDEQRKNNFIGMVSHELKTPLTSLTGYLQMMHMQAKKAGNAYFTGMLEKSTLQVKKMTAMINGFLDVSRLESGKIHLEKQNFALNALVEDLIAEVAYSQASHQITLLPCDTVMVNADRDKIGNVISNLLSNAIKYSPNRKPVQVTCQAEAHQVKVSVTDKGLGISKADQGKLFDRFYRVQNANTKTIAGFGIGLYLCAEIIKRHEGEIGVQSQPGEGSTFYFTLPAEL
jgi:two-component system sensor histidine kinase VicK